LFKEEVSQKSDYDCVPWIPYFDRWENTFSSDR